MSDKSVLIIDDDDLLCEMLAQLLELEGFAVDVAENGAVGLERLARNRYDAVLLDLVMPHMDGIRFLRLLPAHCPDPPPIIITSALVTDQIFAEMREYGVVAIARKPVESGKLVAELHRVLSAGESRV